MNDSALAMKVVQANQDLFSHSTDDRQRNALVIVSFHDLKKIDTQNLEHHYEMLAIRPRMYERVQQLDRMAVLNRIATFLLIDCITLLVLVDRVDPVFSKRIPRHNIKNLNFIVCGFRVV